MKTLTRLSVCLLGVLAMAAAATSGPLTRHSEERVDQLASGHDMKELGRQSRVRMPPQDRKLAAWLAAHPQPERVRAAVESVRPCPPMPEALLLLLGNWDDKENARETLGGREDDWHPWGVSIQNDWYHVTVSGGQVVAVESFRGRPGWMYEFPK